MTGQVDDASEKNRSAATSSRKRDDEAEREAGDLAEIEWRWETDPDRVPMDVCGWDGTRWWIVGSDNYVESHKIISIRPLSAVLTSELDTLRADRDRLAGQVAAIRALAASYGAQARNGQDYVIGRVTVAEDIRSALVASSPTTQEAPK